MRKSKRMLVFYSIILIYCLFLFVGKLNTYAWFTDEVRASGEITNATTKDLLSISTGDVIYQSKCEISQKISIKNISDIMIPIKLVDQPLLLHPGETFNKTMKQKVSCEEKEHHYHLLGLNHYIDEMISVPLDQNKLSGMESNSEDPQDKTNYSPKSMNDKNVEPKENDQVDKEKSVQS
ncbi:hypothetical protein AN960_05785 [Bacillus sp. FJAT-25509]|uniref:hypothetical protein n=1 Tax=Bacillus sp. FJAT-25509 TaxID=1712029 RepID=UPI0006FA44F6|nr:hypothetical protein [Bacillus sp. FJAT-25509]KQL41086.1 hypothetical protein AN960_05785 [Bacillus sp. FJAT-25509]